MPEPSSNAPAGSRPDPPAPASRAATVPSPPPLTGATDRVAASSGAVGTPGGRGSPVSIVERTKPSAWRLSGLAKLRLAVGLCFLGSIGLFSVYLGSLRTRSKVEKDSILSVVRTRNTQLSSREMGQIIERDFQAYWKDELLCQYFLGISLVLAYAGSSLLLVDRVWNKLRERKPDDEKSRGA